MSLEILVSNYDIFFENFFGFKHEFANYLIQHLNTHSGWKQPDIIFYLAGNSIVKKLFDGEMLIRTLPTTLLQIFCNIILNSKVIDENILDPDDNFERSY